MLLTPGPVAVPKRILEAQSREMIYHRGAEVETLMRYIVDNMKPGFGCEDLFLVSGSGTNAIEMCLANCCKKDEKILVLSNGEFGNRLAEAASLYSTVQQEKQPVGKGWDLERAKAAMDSSGAQVFAMVYNETSTGVGNHVGEICKYAKSKGMLTIVDAVSAWGAYEFDMPKMGIDFAATASQKALSCPPGLGFFAAGKEGAERAASMKCPVDILDYKKFKKSMEKYQTPWTPPISTMFAVQESLRMIAEKGGLGAHIKSHEEAATLSREFVVKELGKKVFAEEGFYSNTITGFILENADDYRKKLREKHKLVTARDFGELKGKFFRICHLGHIETDELKLALSYIKDVVGGS
jgi:aspartate aminotransferase-like enzyme